MTTYPDLIGFNAAFLGVFDVCWVRHRRFFRSRIDHMIGLRHPLAALAWQMPWQEIEARVAQVFSHKGDVGVAMPDLYLVAEQVQRASVISNAVETCPDVAAWAKNDHWWFHKMVIDRG